MQNTASYLNDVHAELAPSGDTLSTARSAAFALVLSVSLDPNGDAISNQGVSKCVR